MDVRLLIAGIACAGLALGHWVIGREWVLPGLWQASLPATRLGPPTLAKGMVRFTWHIVTLLLVAVATLFFTLAVDAGGDVRGLLLRWLAVFWLAATGLAVWVSRRRPQRLFRFPVPFVFLTVAVCSWLAAG